MAEAPVRASDGAWLTYSEGEISVHAPEGSYAARRAPVELAEAERALEGLERLLQPTEDQRGQPIDIYVVDAPPQLSASDTPDARVVLDAAATGETIVRVLQPAVPAEPLTWSLTRMLVARWFGPAALSAQPVVDGLAGVVAGRIGTGPSVDEADEHVRAQTAGGAFVPAAQEPPGPPSASSPAAATSFVAFLLRSYDSSALQEFLVAYDPARQDDAALAAYHEPLAALEDAWLASLAGGGSSTYAAARKLARQMLPRMRASWPRELEVAAYTLLDTGLAVAFPVLTGTFVNKISVGDDSAILPYAALLLGIFLVTTPIAMRRAYASALLSQDIVLGLQQDVFGRLLRLPHSFHARANVGDLMARLGGDTEQVREAMESVLRSALYSVLKGVLAAVVLFFINPLLALIALATVPLFWTGYLGLRSRLERTSFQAQTLFGEVSSAAHESLSAHAVIKAFGLEKRTLAEYRARLQAFFAAIRRLVTFGSALDASTSAAMTLGQLAVLIAGGYMVSQGQLDVGYLFTFLGTVPMLFEGSTALAGIGRTLEQASGSMDRVLEVVEAPLEVDENPDGVELSPLAGAIRFERVTFGYGGSPVLSELDLTIAAGSNVAIVGPSGCGKTTVINLIMRFWDPQEGRVLFDDHDLRDASLSSLRSQVGIVFQDTFVFDTTMRENIALARPGATDGEVEAVARAAQLESYVAGLPGGYDTVLGERGVRMSGGQRQRLAIARALLRDPAVLILDEATSALDPETEAEIQQTLTEISAGRTTVSITHRLRSAAKADRIFVINGGRLEEQGTHEELIAAGGLYSRLYDEQAAEPSAVPSSLAVDTARLRAVPLFAGLDSAQLTELAQLVRLEDYAPGEYVVREGERGQSFYLVGDGHLDVLVGEDGRERRVDALHTGDYFGEMALIADLPAAASVQAAMPTRVYVLSGRAFSVLVERDPELRRGVDQILEERRQALQGAVLTAERVSA